MNSLLKSLPARCWLISLVLLLTTLATAHFLPSNTLTQTAKLAALAFLFCTVVFFSYLGFKATCNPSGLIAIITMLVAIGYWQASWAIVGLGLFFIAICTGIRFLSSQVKDSGRTLSIEEKWYWYKLHSFFDGFYPRYPKKPKK
ncbi:EexR/EexS family entry exclusion protein [Marinomonas fungiae]|uniref:EexS n=1 Tax=Marinomonas fungiae TaxID=1137284 RepID=A0A0K6ISK9_9GAMM|nr:EexR/EexS family entry exclusion protein [Marinomonas fungiae]CUB06073.1 hypothetical protein Ga0061065_11486 [Marinomonas fungiae]